MKKLFTEEQWKEIELEAKFKTLAIDPQTKKVFCQSDENVTERLVDPANFKTIDVSRDDDRSAIAGVSTAMGLIQDIATEPIGKQTNRIPDNTTKSNGF